MDKLYSVKEVCEYFNINRSTFYRWLKKGKIKVVILPNGRKRVTFKEMERIIND